MQPQVRLKYKWIKQRRKEVLLFLEENYWIDADSHSKTDLENDLGITGDDAYELLEKFGQAFHVDMSNLIFAEYFNEESELFSPLPIILLLKLILLPFALLVLPFSLSAAKEMILYNPFRSDHPCKKPLTVGDLVASSFTRKFSLQKDVALKLI